MKFNLKIARSIHRILVLIVFVCIFSIQTKSQTLTKQKQQALNTYIDYLDFTVMKTYKSMKCFQNYYNTAESYRKGKKTFGFYHKALCAPYDDEEFFEKALDLSKRINKPDAQKLNSTTTAIHQIYQDIIRKFRELEIYNRLKDYQSDKFQRFDELKFEIQKLYKDYNKAHKKMREDLYSVYRKLQVCNKNNIYHYCEQKMIDFLDYEYPLYENWHINFEKNAHTCMFPYNELIKSINKTDIDYYEFKIPEKLKHPEGFYLKRFLGGVLSRIQGVKRNAIDDYNIETVKSSVHSNITYKYLLTEINGVLISEFDSYVWNCEKRGIYFMKYPKLPYSFVIDKKKKNYTWENIMFANSQHITFKITTQPKTVSENTAMALNNYIKFINKEIRNSSDRAGYMRSYNKGINRYKEKGYTTYRNRIPSGLLLHKDIYKICSYYEKAVNDSRFIPKEYRKSLNRQAEALWQIINERQTISQEINEYARSRKYEKDTFSTAYDLVKRFSFFWDEFDKRKQQLYNDVRRIFDSYPVANKQNSWQKSGKVLNEMIDINYQLAKELKKHYKAGEKFSVLTEKTKSFARNILLNQYDNMKGIKRYGRNNGWCPYTPYEDIPKDSKFWADDIDKQALKEKDTVIRNKYKGFIRYYNNVVEEYNKFAELAEGNNEYARSAGREKVFLLRNIRQPDVFTQINPQKTNIEDTLFISMDGYATNNLILLLDVSFSMSKPGKLELLKSSFKKLLKILRPEDKVAVVTYSGNAEIVLNSTSCAEKEKIINVIDNLTGGGSTNISQGLSKAYKTAKNNYITEGNNRIILATDGEFTLSSKINKLVSKNAEKDIHLTVFMYGKTRNEREKLRQLTELGNGNYEIITEKNANIKLVKEAKAIKAPVNK